jgi:hypothetical protein
MQNIEQTNVVEDHEYRPASPSYGPAVAPSGPLVPPPLPNPFVFGAMNNALPATTAAVPRRGLTPAPQAPRIQRDVMDRPGRGRGQPRRVAVRPSERADARGNLPSLTWSAPPIEPPIPTADLVEDHTPVHHATPRVPPVVKRLFNTHLNLRQFVLTQSRDHPVFTDFHVDSIPGNKPIHEVSGHRIGFTHLNVECSCPCLTTNACDYQACKAEAILVLGVSANCYSHEQLIKFLQDFKEVYVAPIIFDMLHSNMILFNSRTLVWQYDENDNRVLATTTDVHDYSTTQKLSSMIWLGQYENSAAQNLHPSLMRVRTDFEAMCFEVVAGTNVVKKYTSLNRLLLSGEHDLTNLVHAPLRPSHFSKKTGNYSWTINDADLENPINYGFQALVKLDVQSIATLGPFWLVKTKSCAYNVPRHLVADLALEISGSPRDHAHFASLLNKAKRKIKDFKSLGDGDLAQACLIATTMAFGQDLSSEVDLLNSFATTNAENLGRHALALKLIPDVRTQFYKYVASALGGMIFSFVVMKLRTLSTQLAQAYLKKFRHLLINIFTFRVAGVATFLPAHFCVFKEITDVEGVTYLPSINYEGVPDTMVVYSAFLAPIVEELVKRIPRTYWWFLPLYEFYEKVFQMKTNTSAAAVVFAMHYFWYRLPLPLAMVVHSMYNMHTLQQFRIVRFINTPFADFIINCVRDIPWTPLVLVVKLFNFLSRMSQSELASKGLATFVGYRVADAMPEYDGRNPVDYMVKVCTDNDFICNLFATLMPNSLGTILLPRLSPVPASNRLSKPKFGLSTDPDELIVVNPHYRKKLQTVHYIVASIIFNSHVPCPFLLDQRVAIASLTRLLIDAPVPTEALQKGWEKHTTKWAKLFRKLWIHVSDKQWLEHIPSTKKRAIFTQALLRLEERGYCAKEDNKIEHHIKDEKSVFDADDGTSRPICSMRPERMSAYGKFFYELGLTMKKLWCKEWFVRNRVYFGSQNAEDIGAAYDILMEVADPSGYWMMVNGDDACIFLMFEGRWLLYKNDMSRMDGHVRREALTNENKFYKKLLMPVLAWLAVRDIDAKVRSRYGLFVKMCRRLSGSGQTTVGNTNQNIVCIDHCFTNTNGSVDQLKQRAAEMGFTAKFVLCEDICDLEFCSKLFWPTADGTVLGAKVGRMLKKIGTMKITKHTLDDYKAAVNAHYNDNFHVPVVNVTLKRILELMKDEKLGKLDDEEEFKIHVSKRHLPNEETWRFFEKRYGVSRHMVECYHEQLTAVETLPINIRVDWLESVFDRDGA